MLGKDIEVGSGHGINNGKTKFFLVLRTVVHVTFLVHHHVVLFQGIFILLNAYDSGVDKLWEACVYSWAFLTNWNMIFQTVFLVLAICHDIMEWRASQGSSLGQKMKYYRDVVFSGLVFPLTLFVSSFFWVTYTIDRELIFPVVYDLVTPFWFNHCVHTDITVLVLLETVLQARRHPANEKTETRFVISVEVLYAFVYHAIFLLGGRWLYGVHGIMNWWQLCFFQLLVWTSGYLFYKVQFPINRLFHRKEGEVDSDKIAKVEFEESKKNVEDQQCYLGKL